MYCQKCYTNLTLATDNRQCPKCNRPFDPATPRTFLQKPFPSKSKILVHIIATSIITAVVAGIVAFFQLAGASGH